MRLHVYVSFLLLGLVTLVSGLFHIQIGMHERYKMLSEGNRLKIVPLLAPRGGIYDRNGNPFVKDVLSFNACVIYSQIKDSSSLVKELSALMGEPKEVIAEKIKNGAFRRYSPVSVVSDIGMEKAVKLEEIAGDHPGLLMEVSTKREYIYGSSAANILGYLGTINRSEFERLKHYGYSINDLVGRDGVERYYDDYLRGTPGGKQIEVDHLGRESMTLGYKEPIPGKDIFLTVDLDLQLYCDELMKGRKGAIVAMDPRTGEILAMSSSPSFDPAIFVDPRKRSRVRTLLNDRQYPLMNRAISGAYPPGSVFKAVVGLAALETGTINVNTTFCCNGSVEMGSHTFHCWKKDGHGDQSLREALKHSCNVFFWRTGSILGVDNIAKYAKRFNIGNKTGIDLPSETSGVLPSPEWKQKQLKDIWYKGETMNYSVGQGYLLTSPLQMAVFMSVFANKGDLVRPYIVDRIADVHVNSPVKTHLDLTPKHVESVREGLKAVVNEERGTGVKARVKDVVVAGKTGTAQTSKGIDHGWFAGFAPYNDAKLTVVVFDEYGGKGGYYAAETAGKVLAKAQELGLI